MVQIYQAANLIDAHLVKGLLAQQGILAYISGEHLSGGVGELPALGFMALLVDEKDVAAARVLIERFDRGELALAE